MVSWRTRNSAHNFYPTDISLDDDCCSSQDHDDDDDTINITIMPAETPSSKTDITPGTPGTAVSLVSGDLPPMSPPTPTIGGGECSGHATSFTADSPYFSSYVDAEMASVNVLHDTVRDVSARARTFGKCGALMAEATRRLSQACRLQPSGASASAEQTEGVDNKEKENNSVEEPRQAVGPEMESCLKILGGVSYELCLICLFDASHTK